MPRNAEEYQDTEDLDATLEFEQPSPQVEVLLNRWREKLNLALHGQVRDGRNPNRKPTPTSNCRPSNKA